MHVVYDQQNNNMSKHTIFSTRAISFISSLLMYQTFISTTMMTWPLINSEWDCEGIYCDITFAC